MKTEVEELIEESKTKNQQLELEVEADIFIRVFLAELGKEIEKLGAKDEIPAP